MSATFYCQKGPWAEGKSWEVEFSWAAAVSLHLCEVGWCSNSCTKQRSEGYEERHVKYFIQGTASSLIIALSSSLFSLLYLVNNPLYELMTSPLTTRSLTSASSHLDTGPTFSLMAAVKPPSPSMTCACHHFPWLQYTWWWSFNFLA